MRKRIENSSAILALLDDSVSRAAFRPVIISFSNYGIAFDVFFSGFMFMKSSIVYVVTLGRPCGSEDVHDSLP